MRITTELYKREVYTGAPYPSYSVDYMINNTRAVEFYSSGAETHTHYGINMYHPTFHISLLLRGLST